MDVLIAHNLASVGGWTFIASEGGTACVFGSVQSAEAYMREELLDRRIWNIVVLGIVKAAD